MNGRPVWAVTSRENPATTASTAAPRTMGYHWCTPVVNEDEEEDMASKSPYQSPNRPPIWNCRGKPPPSSAVGTEASRAAGRPTDWRRVPSNRLTRPERRTGEPDLRKLYALVG